MQYCQAVAFTPDPESTQRCGTDQASYKLNANWIRVKSKRTNL